ncbi:MAG: alpha/beta hydrolase, partial [Chitinophagales bacterium]|nr:alpha/beta hydrolase [Chitinophagales bacterium]
PYPIIYLHGGPGGFITDRNIATLSPLAANGFDVYLYDQIGSGHSSHLKNISDYTALRHENDLEEIVKQIGKEKVILIAQSWGAILAAMFVADHPEQVAKIIFTSPGPIQPVISNLSQTKIPDSIQLRLPMSTNAEANRKLMNLRMRCAIYFASAFGIKLVPEKEADDFETYLTNGTNKSVVCDTANALKAEGGGGFYVSIITVNSFGEMKNPRPALKNSAIPILVMKGECDNQKWGATNEYLQLFPNRVFKLIPNAGHAIAIEQPEIYLKTIEEFLN